MSDNIKAECSTCGFEWVAGQNGGHSCALRMEEKNDKLTQQVAELEFSLGDRDCYIADADMKSEELTVQVAELRAALGLIKSCTAGVTDELDVEINRVANKALAETDKE